MIDMYGWKITEEQITSIKNKEIEAINNFYFDNEERLRKCAMRYASERNFYKKGVYCDIEDLMQQLYVDIPYLDYSTGRDLSFSIFRYSFYFCDKGGYAYLKETNSKYLFYDYSSGYDSTYLIVDAPANNGEESEIYLLDYIASSPSVEDVVLNSDDCLEELKDLLLTFLTTKEYQFFLNYYRGLKPSVIFERFGMSPFFDSQVKMKLRLHCKEILQALDNLGVECIERYKTKLFVVYDDALNKFEKRKKLDAERKKQRRLQGKIKPLTEEQYQRKLECQRIRYHKRRAEQQAIQNN